MQTVVADAKVCKVMGKNRIAQLVEAVNAGRAPGFKKAKIVRGALVADVTKKTVLAAVAKFGIA